MGDGFLVLKLPSCLFYVSNYNLHFAQGLTIFFPLCIPFKLWWFLCYGLFFLQLHYCLFFLFTFPWSFSKKSGNIYLFFPSYLFNIQRILSIRSFSVSCLFGYSIRIFLLVYLFIYHSYTDSFSPLSHLFELFSILLIYLFRVLVFVELC